MSVPRYRVGVQLQPQHTVGLEDSFPMTATVARMYQ